LGAKTTPTNHPYQAYGNCPPTLPRKHNLLTNKACELYHLYLMLADVYLNVELILRLTLAFTIASGIGESEML
jgi:hypothetical protein